MTLSIAALSLNYYFCFIRGTELPSTSSLLESVQSLVLNHTEAGLWVLCLGPYLGDRKPSMGGIAVLPKVQMQTKPGLKFKHSIWDTVSKL